MQQDIQTAIKLLSMKINAVKIDIQSEILPKRELSVGTIFDIEKGKAAYTRAYIKQHPGPYPVFSSQTTDNGLIGTVDGYDHDKECITWTTDGVNAGTVFLRRGKFSMTTHCGALVLKDAYKDTLDLEYLFFFLNGALREKAYGEQNKRVTKTIIQKIEVPVPTDENGKIDLPEQRRIVNKLKIIDQIRIDVSRQLTRLIETNIRN